MDRDEIRRVFESYDYEEAGKLINEWGDDLERNVAIASAVAADTGIVPLLEELGIADHPHTVKLLAHAGRQLGYAVGVRTPPRPVPAHAQPVSPHNARTASQPTSPGPTTASLQGAIASSNKRIAELQAEGRTKEANAEYQAQQAMITAAKGNQPIVDGSRRTA